MVFLTGRIVRTTIAATVLSKISQMIIFFAFFSKTITKKIHPKLFRLKIKLNNLLLTKKNMWCIITRTFSYEGRKTLEVIISDEGIEEIIHVTVRRLRTLLFATH